MMKTKCWIFSRPAGTAADVDDPGPAVVVAEAGTDVTDPDGCVVWGCEAVLELTVAGAVVPPTPEAQPVIRKQSAAAREITAETMATRVAARARPVGASFAAKAGRRSFRAPGGRA